MLQAADPTVPVSIRLEDVFPACLDQVVGHHPWVTGWGVGMLHPHPFCCPWASGSIQQDRVTPHLDALCASAER
jgi:hypothetical protein